ncbi:glycosyltransferase family 4 protein [Vineibacter terrae]|uniref:Glycosyltransferase family 4 protein n=1 Tax=Vineibacter terrae TaxID=2586908 RepID=A0A5C8P8L7_9HYPH|nr:glycosyltransferase [Vineibacter terrae]TXL69904.1 glycosyltransferase family 4 protein [Vineibacter terrae]
MTVPLKVLIVSPIPSHPAVQGNSVRILAFGAELKRRGVMADFLYYGMEGLSKEQAEVMIGFWHRFFFVRSQPLSRPSHARSWGIDDWCADQLCDTVRELAATHRYDAIIVNYVWMSKVLTGIHGPLKVIDTHDLFGDRHLTAEEQGLEPRWFFTTVEEERRGFERADVVIAIQENEAEAIQDRFTGKVLTVGHPVEPGFLTGPWAPNPSFTFGYLGSGNPWNVRSVLAIDAALARDRVARWALAGTISRRRLSLQSHPFLLGVVERVERFYDVVECVLNPMLGGTGLKIKTIEAIAFGKPVIGTRDAFEGMRPEHDFHRLDTIDAMIGAMKAYTTSGALREELALSSRSLFVRYMAAVTQGYDALVTLIRQHRTSRARTRDDTAATAGTAGRFPNRLAAPAPPTG